MLGEWCVASLSEVTNLSAHTALMLGRANMHVNVAITVIHGCMYMNEHTHTDHIIYINKQKHISHDHIITCVYMHPSTIVSCIRNGHISKTAHVSSPGIVPV